MADAKGNKAKGRRSSKHKGRRTDARVKRLRRKNQRKIDREKRIAAAKASGHVRTPSPSDQRRAAARARGLKSDRIRVYRKTPEAEKPAQIEAAYAARPPETPAAPSA
jgi:hypothetical protein